MGKNSLIGEENIGVEQVLLIFGLVDSRILAYRVMIQIMKLEFLIFVLIGFSGTNFIFTNIILG